MVWPLSQDYNEAVQTPRSSFADPELQRGQVSTNALGIPLPCSGNMADVYEVRCPTGSRWAVKCFTREVRGLRDRYQEISRWLRQARLPFTVEFMRLTAAEFVHDVEGVERYPQSLFCECRNRLGQGLSRLENELQALS